MVGADIFVRVDFRGDIRRTPFMHDVEAHDAVYVVGRVDGRLEVLKDYYNTKGATVTEMEAERLATLASLAARARSYDAAVRQMMAAIRKRYANELDSEFGTDLATCLGTPKPDPLTFLELLAKAMVEDVA